MEFTTEQRLQAAKDWVERTKLGGKVTMTTDNYGYLVREYALSPPTSYRGLIVTLQCELNATKKEWIVTLGLLTERVAYESRL